jgi:dTDP-4-dehydrorhamnose reductase
MSAVAPHSQKQEKPLPPARAGAGEPLRGPVAIVGGGGMLARAFLEQLGERRVEARAFGRAEVDITSPESVAALKSYPTIINGAAWTNVDGAEADEEGATRLNATAVGVLADFCCGSGATLVHFGTDYVFSGNATEPYALDAPIAPVNAYGRSKAAGEEVLREQIQRGLKVLYARTSWLYAPWGKNFVRTIAAASATRPELRVVNDQRGRPTSSIALARATLAMLDRGALGVTHLTDGGECTWFDLAAAIVQDLGRPCRVVPCASSEFPRPAARPAYSVLDLSNAQSLIGDLPDWRVTLRETLQRLEA